MQWVNHGLFMVHGYGSPLDARDAATIARLRDSASSNLDWRRRVFEMFRDPGAGPTCTSRSCRRSLAMRYGEGPEAPKDALTLLAVTPTQYAHLQRWLAGNVSDDWPGAPPVPPAFATLPPAEQVAHLERAPLADCLGGPFHPGIELTWTMRLAAGLEARLSPERARDRPAGAAEFWQHAHARSLHRSRTAHMTASPPVR